MLRSTFSTTTMASSTTMPMASSKPNSESLLSEEPNAESTAKVPISDTGMATMGTIDARQVCRNRMMTTTTRTTASNMVWITASTDCEMNTVGLYTISYLSPAGKDSDSFFMAS